MPGDHPLNNGQPETETSGIAIAAPVQTGKGLKYTAVIGFGDPRPIVVHIDQAIPALFGHDHFDAPVGVRGGILDEIAQRAAHISRFQKDLAIRLGKPVRAGELNGS
jgi:hypothetical protein